MNRLYKLASIAALVGLTPFAALAATSITNLTLNGLSNTTVDEGDNVDGRVTFDLSSGDDAESASWEILGAGLPKTCVNITDRVDDGTFNASFDIETVGATPGSNYDVRVIVYGTNGIGANQTCQGGGDDTMTFSDVLTINDNDSSVGTPDNNDSAPSWLSAILAQMQAQFAALLAAINPPQSSACAQYQQYSGLSYGMRSPSVTSLQVFLLGQGQSIPAGATSYFGPQTQAAVSNFLSVNRCG